MKEVFSTTSPPDAELVRVELRSHGIDSFLENEFGAQTAIGLPTTLIPLVVCVDEERFAEADEIVRRRLEHRAPPAAMPRFVASTCTACGKALDVPEGDDPPEECPWCGRPAGGGSRT